MEHKVDPSLRGTDELLIRDDFKIEKFLHRKRVGDYMIGKCIGKGSFAVVYEAMHTITGEMVAMKVVSKERCLTDEYMRKNLRREGMLLQKLRHPHLVQLFEILETKRTYYLALELCIGESMLQRIENQGRLTEAVTRRYLRQIVSAVKYLHDNGIIHRDLKVENLLLTENDQIKIIDFGLSTQVSINRLKNSRSVSALSHKDLRKMSIENRTPSRLTHRKLSTEKALDTENEKMEPSQFIEELCLTQCGSPAYTAPEVLSRKPYGLQADIWSVGVNLYAMLVGKLPFTIEPFSLSGLWAKMMKQQINPIPSDVSTGAIDLIRSLLNPNPRLRSGLTQVMRHAWLIALDNDERSVTRNRSGITHQSINEAIKPVINQEKNDRRSTLLQKCPRRVSFSALVTNEKSEGQRNKKSAALPSSPSALTEDSVEDENAEHDEQRLQLILIDFFCSYFNFGSNSMPSPSLDLQTVQTGRQHNKQDIIFEICNNIPGKATATYNLLKMKAKRYCKKHGLNIWELLSSKATGTTNQKLADAIDNKIQFKIVTRKNSQEKSKEEPRRLTLRQRRLSSLCHFLENPVTAAECLFKVPTGTAKEAIAKQSGLQPCAHSVLINQRRRSCPGSVAKDRHCFSSLRINSVPNSPMRTDRSSLSTTRNQSPASQTPVIANIIIPSLEKNISSHRARSNLPVVYTANARKSINQRQTLSRRTSAINTTPQRQMVATPPDSTSVPPKWTDKISRTSTAINRIRNPSTHRFSNFGSAKPTYLTARRPTQNGVNLGEKYRRPQSHSTSVRELRLKIGSLGNNPGHNPPAQSQAKLRRIGVVNMGTNIRKDSCRIEFNKN